MDVLLLKYLKPMEEVEVHRPAHREFLDQCYREGKLICSGVREPPIGGVILANVDSELEAMKIVVDDPYFAHKVAEYEVVRFTPNKWDPRFAPFVAVKD